MVYISMVIEQSLVSAHILASARTLVFAHTLVFVHTLVFKYTLVSKHIQVLLEFPEGKMQAFEQQEFDILILPRLLDFCKFMVKQQLIEKPFFKLLQGGEPEERVKRFLELIAKLLVA